MPDANTVVSPKKKGLTLAWAIVLVFFALLFLFAIAAPKFGRFQARTTSEVPDNVATTEQAAHAEPLVAAPTTD